MIGHRRGHSVVLDMNDVHPFIRHNLRQVHQRTRNVMEDNLYPGVAVRQREALSDDSGQKVHVQVPAAQKRDDFSADADPPFDQRGEGGGARGLHQHALALEETQDRPRHVVVLDAHHLIDELLDERKR